MIWNISYIFISIIVLLSIFIISEYNDANAYSYYKCPDIALTTYKPDASVPSDYLKALRLAVANWNNIGSGLSITETNSDNARIIIKTIYEESDVAGKAWAVCDSQGRRIPPAIIELNRYKMDNHDILQKQNTIAHELGHAVVGLGHNIGTATNYNATHV